MIKSSHALLYIYNPVPASTPHVLRPHFDLDVLKKLEATLTNISAYLDKAGVGEWWKDWMMDASTQTSPQSPEPLRGMYIYMYILQCYC